MHCGIYPSIHSSKIKSFNNDTDNQKSPLESGINDIKVK
ncbi:hypothetical protein C8D97_104126 [Pleionea mediterranea]|uniref:Uncharacterized protein n=1 Tax=Pleionea mediterranea TaxID=523701 RepID=A0A316FWE4_9GAMM|nr:hypothetical protein C8D97_104126 [Pleionea mediterranea]